MWFCLGFGAACAWGAYFQNRFWLAIAVVLLVLAVSAAVFARWKKELRIMALICLGCAVGLCWFRGFDTLYLHDIRELDGQTVTMTLRAKGYSAATDYGVAIDGTIEVDGWEYNTRLYLNEPEDVTPGDLIIGQFHLQITTDGGEQRATYHQGEGIFLLAYQQGVYQLVPGEKVAWGDYPVILRQSITELLEQIFPKDTAAFAKALLLGDTTSLDYETDTAFKISGIRHVVAVSGLHISILFSAVYLFSGKRRWLTALLGTPVVLLFAAVAGFTPSVIRACMMQILMMLAMLFEREYDPPTALSFSALVMLTANPLTITSVSFQLSVGCMAGILLFSCRIRGWILSNKCWGEVKGNGLKVRLKRWFAGSVSVTLGAMVMTAPLSAWYFGTVSLVGILTNLLTLWAISYIFYGIMLACILGGVWFSVGQGIAWMVAWGIRYVQLMANLLAGLPLSAVYTKSVYIVAWLVFCYVLIAVFLLGHKKHPGILAGCVMLGLCTALLVSWLEPLMGECRVTVLDVGQGQCILLQSEGKNYLVDCGGNSGKNAADEAAETLLSQGISRLDGMILTHYDADHSGGAEYLMSRVDTDSVFVPNTVDENTVGTDIAAQTTGAVLRVEEITELSYGDTKLTIFPSALVDSSNESSLCILFQTKNCAILITGDRSDFGEQMLLRQTVLPDVDVLIVGHHGSKNSTCEGLLQATTPEIAIISVGKGNRYGHPAQEVLDRLEKYGCTVYRTDLNGTTIFAR